VKSKKATPSLKYKSMIYINILLILIIIEAYITNIWSIVNCFKAGFEPADVMSQVFIRNFFALMVKLYLLIAFYQYAKTTLLNI